MYKLLIADDNVYERNGLAKLKMWQEFGFHDILLAENGSIGYELALKEKPLLVITDVQMPTMDGITMSKKIMEALPETKIIFMSCFDDSQYIRSAFDVNAFSYILKPLNIPKLRQLVKKILQINETELEKSNMINKLEQQLKDNIPILRKHLMHDLIYGNLDETMKIRLEKVDMGIKSYCSIAVLEVDNFEDISENPENDKIYYATNRINELIAEFDTEEKAFSIVLNKKRIAIIHYLDKASLKNEAEEKTLEFLSAMRQEINKKLAIEVSVCIGGVCTDCKTVSQLFERAQYVLNTSLFQKNNRIVFADDVQANKNLFDYSFLEMEEEIVALMEHFSESDLLAFVDKYYSSDYIYDTISLKAITTSIISIIQVEFMKINENFANVFGNEYVIWEKLANFESILDIRQWITNIIRSVCLFVKNKKSSRHIKTIARIKEIIDEEYAAINSVSDIASKLYISTVHANQLFKKYTGETIFDYLTNYKIERAKEFLREENSRVYEVAEKVGYKSKTYFSALFKEYTGMTPREFREHEGNV